MYERYINQVLIDPSNKHKVFQVMDVEKDWFLCYFFLSTRTVWLNYKEVKELGEKIVNKPVSKNNTEPAMV